MIRVNEKQSSESVSLSFHSNESTLATAIENIIFVEANVLQSFSFIPLMAFEVMIFEYRINFFD